MNELATIESGPLSAQQVRGQVNLIQEVMRDVMKVNEHYGKIPGCGDKPTLLQPGAQKLIMTFRLVADPEMTIIDMGGGHREVRCKVRLYNQSGTFLGAGVGTCSTMEGKYRYRSGPVEFTDKPVPKEYWDLRAKDPKKAQSLLGEGMQAKKNESGMWVCARKGQQVEHDNPADYYNTVEKMSYKRALVSATLTVTAASDIFTQDIEDMPEVIPGEASSEVGAARQANQQKMKSMQQPVEQDGASVNKDVSGTRESESVMPSKTSDAAPPADPEGPPPSGLTADLACRQMRAASNLAELSGIMNQWLADDHFPEEREQVSAVFNEMKRTLGKHSPSRK